VQRLMAEAKGLNMKGRATVLEEAETLRLSPHNCIL
jgi:hypothetical protein